MNSTNRNFHEKRNYIRMKVETPASVVVSTEESTLEGICKDLSGGGMLLELSTTLPVGTEALVEIASGHGHAPMLKAKTRVTRIDAQPNLEAQPCVIGMEIVEVLN